MAQKFNDQAKLDEWIDREKDSIIITGSIQTNDGIWIFYQMKVS